MLSMDDEQSSRFVSYLSSSCPFRRERSLFPSLFLSFSLASCLSVAFVSNTEKKEAS